MSQSSVNSLLQGVIDRVLGNERDITYPVARNSFDAILSGEGAPELVAAFLVAIHDRGESVAELAVAIDAVRATQRTVNCACDGSIDVGGMGGDRGATFNVSTTAALVTAAAGIKVCKHGSSAISGQCGSMDVVSGLGCPLARCQADVDDQLVAQGIIFLSTDDFLEYPLPLRCVRRTLGVATIFNLVGPFCNPARVKRQVIGVSDEKLFGIFATIVCSLSYERVLIIYDTSNITDEFSVSGETQIAEVNHGTVAWYSVTPSDFGLAIAQTEEISGGDTNANTRSALDIIEGRDLGPRRSVVLMTTAAGIYAAGKACNLYEACVLARNAIDYGSAASLLTLLRAKSEAPVIRRGEGSP
jgi:anthranilate phosphoribosyltransferase